MPQSAGPPTPQRSGSSRKRRERVSEGFSFFFFFFFFFFPGGGGGRKDFLRFRGLRKSCRSAAPDTLMLSKVIVVLPSVLAILEGPKNKL